MSRNRSLKNKNVNNRNELIVGIDIAKNTHFATLLFNDGLESNAFSFVNTKAGFLSFVQWLQDNLKAIGIKEATVGMESTGHYWKPLAYFLDKITGINLVQVNPAHVKKAKELYDNSPGKTDPKDASVIAMLIKMGRFHRLRLPQGAFVDLRVCAKFREQKIVEQGIQRNILHSLIDTIFPEYGKIFAKLESKTSLYLLERYTTPDRMVSLGLPRLTKAIRKASRGKLAEKKAKELLEAAKSTIGVTAGLESFTLAIRETVRGLRRISNELQVIDERLSMVLQEVPYAKQLLSIKGIGLVTLAVILGEVGDLRRFRKAEEIIKLAGLNLYEISSGQHHGRRRITKRGRPLLRKILFFATLRLVKKGGIFRNDYLRLTEGNNMQKIKALVALSKKILRVIFALARDSACYREKECQLPMAA